LASALEGHIERVDGKGELGQLSSAEKEHLLKHALAHWRTHGSLFFEGLEEFGKSISGKGELSQRLAGLLASLAADAIKRGPKDENLDARALAFAAVYAAGGNEAALGHMIEGLGPKNAGYFGDALARPVFAQASNFNSHEWETAAPLGRALTALNRAHETEAARQFALHAFASADESTYCHIVRGKRMERLGTSESAAAAPMAAAMARFLHPGGGQAQAAEEQRLKALMTSEFAVQLFAPDRGNDRASNISRMQMLDALIAYPKITAKSLLEAHSFWDTSPYLNHDLAQGLAPTPTGDLVHDLFTPQMRLLTFGDAALEYRNTDLDNMIGTALQLEPEKAPKDGKLAAAHEAAAAKGDYSFYKQEQVGLVRDAIREAGKALGGNGSAPAVTVLPLHLSSPEYGSVQIAAFRVDRKANGQVQSQFVDYRGGRYASFEELLAKTALPDGAITYPVKIDPKTGQKIGGYLTADASGEVQLESTDTAETHNTWHHVRSGLDKGVMVVGIAAGGLVIVGSGGTAAPAVVLAASAYGAGRAVEHGFEMHSRNQGLMPWDSSEARSMWLNGLANLASAAAAGVRMATLPLLLRSGAVTISPAGRILVAKDLAKLVTITPAGKIIVAEESAKTVIRAALAAHWAAAGLNGAAFVNNQIDASQNWDHMSADEKIQWGLYSAFFVASMGLNVRQGIGFQRLYAKVVANAGAQQGRPPAGVPPQLLPPGRPLAGQQAHGGQQPAPTPLSSAGASLALRPAPTNPPPVSSPPELSAASPHVQGVGGSEDPERLAPLRPNQAQSQEIIKLELVEAYNRLSPAEQASFDNVDVFIDAVEQAFGSLPEDLKRRYNTNTPSSYIEHIVTEFRGLPPRHDGIDLHWYLGLAQDFSRLSPEQRAFLGNSVPRLLDEPEEAFFLAARQDVERAGGPAATSGRSPRTPRSPRTGRSARSPVPTP
jgi:Domain of unknown function (DUF4781)